MSVNGQTVKGCPFPLSVAPDPASLGKPVRVIEGLNRPWGVAINSKGYVIVTECVSHQVSVYDREWRKIRSFGGKGKGDGRFNQPKFVTVDGDDNVYVADCENHRIQKFTSDGVFIASVGSRGDGQLQFSFPCGVGYNKVNGKIYVSSFHKIQVLNTDLTFHAAFGRQGKGDGEFEFPLGISFDTAGNVLVADSCKDCVQVFTANGKFTRKLDNHNEPQDVAVDHSTGVVYVTEPLGNRVSMFTATGQYIQSFGSEGSGDGQIKDCIGIVIDEDQNILVADKNNRLQMF